MGRISNCASGPARPRFPPPTDHDAIVRALVERGVREDKGRQLLMNLPGDQPVMDQIEWVDAEVARKAKTSQAILNPAGFPIYVLHSNHAVPATFITSRRRQSIARACQETERERALEARREREQRRTCETSVRENGGVNQSRPPRSNDRSTSRETPIRSRSR